jgi:hypothetical protein
MFLGAMLHSFRVILGWTVVRFIMGSIAGLAGKVFIYEGCALLYCKISTRWSPDWGEHAYCRLYVLPEPSKPARSQRLTDTDPAESEASRPVGRNGYSIVDKPCLPSSL